MIRTGSRSTRRRGISTPFAALAVTALALTACGTGVTSDAASPATTGPALTVTNCGRELTFAAAPGSVVGLMPSQTEMLIQLGAVDTLVGQAQTDVSALPADIAAKATGIPVLSTDAPPAREELLATEPDLVVSPTEYEFTAEQGFTSIEQLNQNGAQAYVATGGCLDRRSNAKVTDVLTDITNLGRILRTEEAAEKLLQDAEQRLAAIETALDGANRLSVAQVYVEGASLSAIGAGIEADIIDTAGGENVFDANAPEFADFFAAEINPEEITSRAPEAIVFGVTGPEQEEQTLTYLRSTFPDTPAVRQDRLIAVPQSQLHPGTLGNIDAAESIAQQLYPDAF